MSVTLPNKSYRTRATQVVRAERVHSEVIYVIIFVPLSVHTHIMIYYHSLASLNVRYLSYSLGKLPSMET